MREIIKVKDALAWFEEDRKFESKYRKHVNCNMPDGFKLSNEPNVYYAGFPHDFEHDSSPEAWMHYKQHYTVNTFSKTEDDEEDKYRLDFLCYQTNSTKNSAKKFHVLTAVNKRNKLPKKCQNVPSGSCNLRGDCDFNFNEKKYPRFLEKLFNGAVKKEEVELLIKCHDMHHTLLNFSLMQGVGGMNNLKGCFLRIDCEDGKKEQPQLDRLDKFVTFLKEYFEIIQSDKEERLKKLKAGQRGSNNAEYLRDYLDQFGCVYNYCANIYFLPTEDHRTGMMIKKNVNINNEKWKDLLEYNKNLIDDLLKLGSTSLTEDNSVQLKFSYQNEEKEYSLRDRVVEYMLLAVRFWQAKEKYFELMDKIFEDEKKNNPFPTALV